MMAFHFCVSDCLYARQEQEYQFSRFGLVVRRRERHSALKEEHLTIGYSGNINENNVGVLSFVP
jgi:hypothetical protein